MEINRLSDKPYIDNKDIVKLTSMGNVLEVQYMEKRNSKQTIQMLPGNNNYVVLSTGEVKDVEKYTSRLSGKDNLRKTFNKLRALINTNVTNVNNVRWITLTYKENMQDTKRLYLDFRDFNKRFQYYLKKNNLGKAEYIVVAEPQARGAWHMHLLYIWSSTAPFIPNSVLADIWGLGFVKITELDNVDNVGAYLTAYLADIPADEFDFSEYNFNYKYEVVEKEGKRYIKGGRLYRYPPKMNIYRCSRGVKQPDVDFMSYENALKKVSSAKLTFESSVQISDPDTDFSNTIYKCYYNSKRK